MTKSKRDRLSFKTGILKLRLSDCRSEREKRFATGNKFKGLKIIMHELESQYNTKCEFSEVEEIDKFDLLLISLTSYVDVWNLIYTFSRFRKKPWKCKILIGGAAVVNIKSYYHIGDVFAYGRGEKTIHEIIEHLYLDVPFLSRHAFVKGVSDLSFEHTFRLSENFYNLKSKSIAETSYGCYKNCFFCQYTNVSKVLPSQSSKGQWYRIGHEANINDMLVSDGRRYTTSFDGVSQHLRFAFNKKIKDSDIIAFFLSIPRLDNLITLKIFNLCGLPTESYSDFDKQVSFLNQIADKVSYNNIKIQMVFTPFTPEPCTPAEFLEADIFEDYRSFFNNYPTFSERYVIDKPNFKMYINNRIPSGYSLLKRMIINRFEFKHKTIVEYITTSKFHRDKNVTHARKLSDLLDKFELSDFYKRLEVGNRKPFQEITSRKGSATLLKESQRLEKNLFCPQGF